MHRPRTAAMLQRRQGFFLSLSHGCKGSPDDFTGLPLDQRSGKVTMITAMLTPWEDIDHQRLMGGNRPLPALMRISTLHTRSRNGALGYTAAPGNLRLNLSAQRLCQQRLALPVHISVRAIVLCCRICSATAKPASARRTPAHRRPAAVFTARRDRTVPGGVRTAAAVPAPARREIRRHLPFWIPRPRTGQNLPSGWFGLRLRAKRLLRSDRAIPIRMAFFQGGRTQG